jgi:UPF0716 protein FxsA
MRFYPKPMRFPVIPLFLLALPFLEIAGFVIVGQQIGVLYTLALVVASGILGAILLRIQGFGAMSRIRRELDAGGDPGREVAHGAMILLAGVLLLIPGFVTDIIGLLLFLPPVRDLAWGFLRDRVVVSAGGFGGFARPGAGSGARPHDRRGGKTIDLDADEYSSSPDGDARADSPWRRIDSD